LLDLQDSDPRGELIPDRPQAGKPGQISRHVTDISRTTGWYRDVLGLPHPSSL